MISKNAVGDWWQIEYGGQLAWVYGGLVTPSANVANVPQAEPSGWLTYDDAREGGDFNGVTGRRGLKLAANVSTPGRIRTHDPLIRSQML